MSQAAGPSQRVEYAIRGFDVGKVGTFAFDDDDKERVEEWFKQFQRTKRTYPWHLYGEETDDFVRPNEAWDVLNDFGTDTHEDKSYFVPLPENQTLIDAPHHRDDLWDSTAYTSRGVVGYYGEGFACTFHQNVHMCMDRTFIVLRGKVRNAVQCKIAYAIYLSAYAICLIAYAILTYTNL